METTLTAIDDEEGSGVQEERGENCECNIKHLLSHKYTHIDFLMM